VKSMTAVLAFLVALTIEFSMIQTVEAQYSRQNPDCSGSGGYAHGGGGYGGGYARGGYESRPGPPCPETNTSNAPMRIFVARLGYEFTDDALRELFSSYGQVQSAEIILDRNTGRSRGFGFVVMPGQAARAAIQDLNGAAINGREIAVQPAE